MSLQLLRHGIGRSTLGRVSGLAIIVSVLGIAQAQVVTHTQLSSASTDHGISFTARVSDSVGNPATDGVITIENARGHALGSAWVKDGEATLTLDQQPSGNVYAVYSGSAGFRSSTAQAQVSDAASTLPDFAISASPTSLSLTPGQYGTVALTITPLNGFNNMVTLSCSGNPANSACIFSPSTLSPLNGTPVTSSLQITTQAPSGAMLTFPVHSSRAVYAIVLPGLLALVGLGSLRKRNGMNALSVLGLTALLAAGTLGLSACSQRYDYLHHPPTENSGITPGTYTVTVAAYSSNGSSVTSHTLNITLSVK